MKFFRVFFEEKCSPAVQRLHLALPIIISARAVARWWHFESLLTSLRGGITAIFLSPWTIFIVRWFHRARAIIPPRIMGNAQPKSIVMLFHKCIDWTLIWLWFWNTEWKMCADLGIKLGNFPRIVIFPTSVPCLRIKSCVCSLEWDSLCKVPQTNFHPVWEGVKLPLMPLCKINPIETFLPCQR